jgi:hypothetical protein
VGVVIKTQFKNFGRFSDMITTDMLRLQQVVMNLL